MREVLRNMLLALDALRRLFFFALFGLGVVLVIYGSSDTLVLGVVLIILGFLLGYFPRKRPRP